MQSRLVLEGKTCKEIPKSSKLEFLEKFLAKNFPLSAEDNTSEPLNREDIADLTLFRTLSNSPKVLRYKFLGSDGLFCFSSICKYGSFKNPFASITILPELYFRFRIITKKMISMNYGSSTTC